MTKLIKNGSIITDGKILYDTDIIIENGYISKLTPKGKYQESSTIDLNGAYVCSGFIDIHCHGGNGYEFIDSNEEAYAKACELHSSHGTRILYPTISASDYQTTYNALLTAEKAISKCTVQIPGIHLEGPYLSKEMGGGQDQSYIRKPNKAEYVKLIERFGNIIARWTYAPEEDDGSFLSILIQNNILASAGHSAAKYDDVLYAYENGCKLVTHIYSCTSTITRENGFRKLGLIESAYLLDDMYVEAIADGCHLPPELLRLIVKIKGADRVCLITDAIRHAGLSNTENIKGGTANMPYIIEDGVAKLTDRSAFAGSIATTDVLLKRAVDAGIPLEQTVKMMTETPAKAMGLNCNGKINEGYEACFTVFDKSFNILDINI